MSIAEIKRQGFDQSSQEGATVHVRCSQCAALVINGVPTHEHGCPNSRRHRHAGLGEFDE